MNTLELKNKTKETIDEIVNEVNEFKVRSEQVEKQMKDEWENEIRDLEKTRDSLQDVYSKISQANENSVKELVQVFEEQKISAQKQIDHLREVYSKTLN